MTIRNLDRLFRPRSVVMVGDGGAEDRRILRSLLAGGLDGPVMPVIPGARSLDGVPAWADIETLPEPPDLAVITRPLEEGPDWVESLGRRGTRAAIFTASRGEGITTDEAARAEQALLEAAAPYLMRLLGPGASVLASSHHGLQALTTPQSLPPGKAALVTVSGAVASSALEWCRAHDSGLSHAIHLGGALDVDLGDCLDYLANDRTARAVLLYLERVRRTRKFMSALRRAARVKPVIVLKPEQTGKDEAEDFVYDAALRRAGVVRVDDLDELFSAVEILGSSRAPARDGTLAIVGDSRGFGLLASNAVRRYGGDAGGLSEAARERLAPLARDPWGSENPLDLGAEAPGEAWSEALAVLREESCVSGILAIKAPGATGDGREVADVLVEANRATRKPVLAAWDPSGGCEGLTRVREELPVFNHPEEAVRAFMRLLQYRRSQALLMETPPSVPEEFEPDTDQVQLTLSAALTAGRRHLNEYQAHRVLTAYGLPCVDVHRASDPEEAGEIAAGMGQPVALKLMSPQVRAKSEVQGVALDLRGAEEVREEAERMLWRLEHVHPGAELDGFVVQPMTRRQGAFELTMGVRPGGSFGPVLFFGHGGTEAAAIDDVAYGLPPLNMHLAGEVMQRTRIHALMEQAGLRRPDLDAVALALIKLSQLIVDFGAVVAVDVNPLWAGRNGVLALDARIRIEPPRAHPSEYLPIRPYPRELESTLTLRDGRQYPLRPVRPEDEPALQAMVRRTPPEQVRMRFFQALKALPHELAARLTQIDYDREMALAITEPGPPGEARMLGMVRISADPDLDAAEYDIMLDPEVSGLGLGRLLMERICAYARRRGIREIYGEVLRENDAMLRINHDMGFTVETSSEDSSILHVRLPLEKEAGAAGP